MVAKLKYLFKTGKLRETLQYWMLHKIFIPNCLIGYHS